MIKDFTRSHIRSSDEIARDIRRQSKICSRFKCSLKGIIQEFSDFYTDNSKVDGRTSWCKACQSEMSDVRARTNNRRRYSKITYNGKSQTECARILGINQSSISKRLKSGWSLKRAMTEGRKLYKGKTLTAWAKILGLTPSAMYERLSSGWSVERATTEKKIMGRK